MMTLFSSDRICTAKEMMRSLRKQIEGLPRMIASIGEMDKILRFEYKMEALDPLSWLHNQKAKVKMYWSQRDEGEEIAGIGMADEIVSSQGYQVVFNKIEERLSADNPRVRYYGGFSFSENSLDEKWDTFGLSRFIVPQFEFSRIGEDYFFAFHINLRDITEENIRKILVDFEVLNFSSETRYRKVPEIIHREDLPDQKGWAAMIEDALSGAAEKTVLARQSQFQFDLKIRPSALIKFLKEQTPHCFHFCLQMDEHTGFLGATPERLFSVANGELISEAVAGTAQNEAELLNSAKYALEHKYVADVLRNQFQQICSVYEGDAAPSVLRLKEGNHLYTRFQGTLKKDMETGAILEGLHPTPAVGGYPKQASLTEIARLEPFARGWYAAPVGAVGYDRCEFLVAIRSGLVYEGDLYLYAGAGIVEGSQVQEEWQEVEQKISRFMKVFER